MEKIPSAKITLESSLKALEIENFIDRFFYRPIGFQISLVLRHTPVTPNMVTILSIFVGVSAGIFFYPNDLILNLIGVLLLIFANILDCVDGQLARLTGIKSKIGRILDGFAGDLWFTSVYVSICLRLINEGWPAYIFAVAVLSGISHSRQAAMADYFKNLHLFILKGSAGSELDDYASLQKHYLKLTWKNDFWEKLFKYFYRSYTRKQERSAPALHDLRIVILEKYPTEIPELLRSKFRQLTAGSIKWMHIMSFNGRTPVLFAAVLLNIPWAYFIFEIVFLNLFLLIGIKQYEIVSKTVKDSILKGLYAEK